MLQLQLLDGSKAALINHLKTFLNIFHSIQFSIFNFLIGSPKQALIQLFKDWGLFEKKFRKWIFPVNGWIEKLMVPSESAPQDLSKERSCQYGPTIDSPKPFVPDEIEWWLDCLSPLLNFYDKRIWRVNCGPLTCIFRRTTTVTPRLSLKLH
jgi:hypothetical protein